MLECAYLVPEVLQRPTAVFEGLKREADQPRSGYGWRCYCGLPDRAYSQDGTPGAPWAREVFLVFVNEELVAYEWYWYPADDQDPNLPEGHDVRFVRRLL